MFASSISKKTTFNQILCWLLRSGRFQFLAYVQSIFILFVFDMAESCIILHNRMFFNQIEVFGSTQKTESSLFSNSFIHVALDVERKIIHPWFITSVVAPPPPHEKTYHMPIFWNFHFETDFRGGLFLGQDCSGGLRSEMNSATSKNHERHTYHMSCKNKFEAVFDCFWPLVGLVFTNVAFSLQNINCNTNMNLKK